MKKLTILLRVTGFVALMFSVFPACGQGDWLCVYPNKKVYFEDSRKEVYCIRIDSTFNNDSILYPFSYLHQIDRDCYSITSGSWLSKYIVLDNDGNTVFINGKNQQIFIKSQAGLNEVWDMFENENIKVKGEIISSKKRDVLGVEDSVKTISFSVYDTNDMLINHTLNQYSIEVSKNFGLIKTVNFYYFEHKTDDYYNRFREFNLIGINEPQLGFQNPNTMEQYFDFQVGDEFHILNISTTFPTTRSHENKIINKCLSRTDYKDSIVYYYESKINGYSIEVVDGKVNEKRYSSIDTLKQTVVKGQLLFNTEPNELYGDSYWDISKVIITNTSPLKMYIFGYAPFILAGTCLYPVPTDICNLYYTYYFGLGGPYYYCEIWHNETGNELKYYKKGDTEWGTPLSIDNIKKDNSDFVRIYPNPANDYINIHLADTYNQITYKLYDVQGRILLSGELTNQHQQIDISNLYAGVYFIRFTDEKQINSVKKVVKIH